MESTIIDSKININVRTYLKDTSVKTPIVPRRDNYPWGVKPITVQLRWANSGLGQTKKFGLTKFQTNFFWSGIWSGGLAIWSGGLANHYFLILDKIN